MNIKFKHKILFLVLTHFFISCNTSKLANGGKVDKATQYSQEVLLDPSDFFKPGRVYFKDKNDKRHSLGFLDVKIEKPNKISLSERNGEKKVQANSNINILGIPLDLNFYKSNTLVYLSKYSNCTEYNIDITKINESLREKTFDVKNTFKLLGYKKYPKFFLVTGSVKAKTINFEFKFKDSLNIDSELKLTKIIENENGYKKQGEQNFVLNKTFQEPITALKTEIPLEVVGEGADGKISLKIRE